MLRINQPIITHEYIGHLGVRICELLPREIFNGKPVEISYSYESKSGVSVPTEEEDYYIIYFKHFCSISAINEYIDSEYISDVRKFVLIESLRIIDSIIVTRDSFERVMAVNTFFLLRIIGYIDFLNRLNIDARAYDLENFIGGLVAQSVNNLNKISDQSLYECAIRLEPSHYYGTYFASSWFKYVWDNLFY